MKAKVRFKDDEGLKRVLTMYGGRRIYPLPELGRWEMRRQTHKQMLESKRFKRCGKTIDDSGFCHSISCLHLVAFLRDT